MAAPPSHDMESCRVYLLADTLTCCGTVRTGRKNKIGTGLSSLNGKESKNTHCKFTSAESKLTIMDLA